jgi:hypothetical protein
VSSGVVVGEVAGQLAVGVGLGQEVLGLLLDSFDRVGAGREAQRRLVLACELDQRAGELGGSPACWPFMPFQAAMVCLVRFA